MAYVLLVLSKLNRTFRRIMSGTSHYNTKSAQQIVLTGANNLSGSGNTRINKCHKRWDRQCDPNLFVLGGC